MDYLVPAIGWTSAVLFILAYVLLSRGKLHGHSCLYQCLNIAGAAGLALSNSTHGAFPSTTLNLVWIGIGVHTLVTRGRRD